MSDRNGCARNCCSGRGSSALECESGLPAREVERPAEQAQSVVEANPRVAELTARLEEAEAALQSERQRCRQLEAKLRQACGETDPGVADRTVELTAANEHLLREVQERTQVEQKQALLLRRVAEINEELTHFAYIVSHDLKAPLRGIKLITEWLCADYGDKLGDEAKEQLDLLQNRVARMHNLIDGVLQYSRVGRIKEDMVQVDLNELLPGIIDGIAPPEHIHITVEPGLPVLECERTRITQVFQNLLGNAVKFMDKPVGQVRVACVEEGDFWQFSVSDNGPGVEEKYFDRIFRLFQTLAPRDEFESTGVGLAVVKKIVEMYGGRIWIESEPGKGCTLLFTWPKRPVQAPDANADL